MLVVTRRIVLIAPAMLLLGVAYTLKLTTLQFQSTRDDLSAPSSNVIGYYTLCNSLGISLLSGGERNGQPGTNLCFAGSFVIALVDLAVVWVFRTLNLTARREMSSTIREILATANMSAILTCGGLTMYALEIVNTYFPLYGKEIGLSPAQIGSVLSASGIGQMAIRPFMHSLTRRLPLFILLGSFIAISAAGIVCFDFAKNYALCIIIAVWTGVSLGILNPLCLFAVTVTVGLARCAKALAVRIMANFAGQSIGPLCFGAIANGAGYKAVIWASGVLLFTGALINHGRRLLPQAETVLRQWLLYAWQKGRPSAGL